MAVPANLTTLIKRLEAATSRLEDLSAAAASQQLVANQNGAPGVAQGSNANAASAGSNANMATAGTAPDTSVPLATPDRPALSAFGALIDGPVQAYVEASQALGGIVANQASDVSKLFKAQQDFLAVVSQCKKPSDQSKLLPLLKDTQSALGLVTEARDPDRARRFDNHLKMVAEGIQALGWVTVEPKPGPFVKDMKDAADFYGNRVIKEYKETDPKHVAFVRAFGTVLEELRKYIMQWHTTGVAWNPNGQDVSSVPQGSAPPAPPAPAPPAPSAPAAPKSGAAAPASSGSGGGGMDAVFAQLNKGGSVTTGLKKVDDSQKTHKNPSLREAAAPTASGGSAPKPPVKPPKPGAAPAKKPPKTELDGNKWLIENHENNQAIVLGETAINQVVHVFNCKSCVLQISGKVNAVSMANSPKTSILLDSAIASVGITNSPGFQVQVTGKVPMITVDSTDGGQLYLSKESLDVEVITSKSSSLNISLPVEGEEDGVFEEKPVPEQLKTVVQDGKLVTTVVEHAG